MPAEPLATVAVLFDCPDSVPLLAETVEEVLFCVVVDMTVVVLFAVLFAGALSRAAGTPYCLMLSL